MSRLKRAVEIVSLLASLGHRGALVGGFAVSARAKARFTKDLDLAVGVASDTEAEALALSLQRHGLRLQAVIEQQATGRLATLRFIDPSVDLREPTVGILCASSGIEPEVVAARR